MSNGNQRRQASGRRSSLPTDMNAAEMIRRMNKVASDHSPTSDITTTFARPTRSRVPSSTTPPNLTHERSPLQRQPTKAKRALRNLYEKARDKTVKFVDEALLSPGRPPKCKVEISAPLRDDKYRASLDNAMQNGRTIISINEAQDQRKRSHGWKEANFVKDKNGVERQRVQTTKELAKGVMNGEVAYVGGSKFDFVADLATGFISHKDFADKNRQSGFFQGSAQDYAIAPRPRAPAPRPSTSAGPSQASASASGGRTLPTLPVNHSAVDAQKPTQAAPQRKVSRRQVVSTWGALIEAANLPTPPSSNDSDELPIADPSDQARRRRVTIINSQAFDPANAGTRQSIANLGPVYDTGNSPEEDDDDDDDDDDDATFNFPIIPTPPISQRLQSLDMGDRFAPFDDDDEDDEPCLQVDTHIRKGHVSWYARDTDDLESSWHTRWGRTDGLPSPTEPIQNQREGDEAEDLWRRIEESTRTGQSLRRSLRGE